MCVCVTLSTQVCESVYVCSVSSILRSPTHQGTQECLVSDTLDHSPYHTTRRTVLLLSGRSVLGDLMPQQRRVFLLCCLLFFPNRGDVYFFSHFPGFFFRDPGGGGQDEVESEYEYERVVNSLFLSSPNKEKKSIIIFPFVFFSRRISAKFWQNAPDFDNSETVSSHGMQTPKLFLSHGSKKMILCLVSNTYAPLGLQKNLFQIIAMRTDFLHVSVFVEPQSEKQKKHNFFFKPVFYQAY